MVMMVMLIAAKPQPNQVRKQSYTPSYGKRKCATLIARTQSTVTSLSELVDAGYKTLVLCRSSIIPMLEADRMTTVHHSHKTFPGNLVRWCPIAFNFEASTPRSHEEAASPAEDVVLKTHPNMRLVYQRIAALHALARGFERHATRLIPGL